MRYEASYRIPRKLVYASNVIILFLRDGASKIIKSRFKQPEEKFVPNSIQRRWYLQSLKIKDSDLKYRINSISFGISQKDIDFFVF